MTSYYDTRAFKTLESLKTMKDMITYYVSDEGVAIAVGWIARLLGLESSVIIREDGEGPHEVRVSLPEDGIPSEIMESLLSHVQSTGISLNGCGLIQVLGADSDGRISRDVAVSVINLLKGSLSKLDYGGLDLLSRAEAILRSDLTFLKVRKISKSRYEGFVYDISVPETELFLGGSSPVALHNTGHPVLSTFHASDIDTLIQRLTNNPINIPKTNIGALNFAWFQSAVYTREGFLARKLVKLYEVIGYYPQNDSIIAIPVFVWDPVNNKFIFSGRGTSYLLEEKIAVMRGIPRSRVKEVYDELELRASFINELVEKKVFDYWDVWRAIIKAGEVGVEKALDLLRKGALL
jgi:hypothetical protein